MTDTPQFRREKRQPVQMRVRFRRDAQDAALTHEGSTNDLGLGGAFVETEIPPAVGSRVVLTVSAPTAWEPLELHGEVRWVKDGGDGDPSGFGVRFHELDGREATALYELVHSASYAEPS